MVSSIGLGSTVLGVQRFRGDQMGLGNERWDLTAARRLGLVALASFAVLLSALAAPPARAAFGFESVRSAFIGPDGEASAALPAGSHPQSWTTNLAFKTTGPPGEESVDGALKDLRIEMPPGLVGVPALLPHCSHADFLAEVCPAATAVGTLVAEIGSALPMAFPLYLLEPAPGTAAQLGLHDHLALVTIDLNIASRPPYNLIATIGNSSEAIKALRLSITLEGAPGGRPFLTLPRKCDGLLSTGFSADSWESPADWVEALAPEPLRVFDCGSLPYTPALTASPTTTAASAPSGLDLGFESPDPGISSPRGRAAADTKAATLVLPPGFSLNPPFAAGLAVCTPAELAAEVSAGESGGCPEASKIGTARVTTPLMAKPVAGALYVAEPDDPATEEAGAENPFDARYALYLVLREPERGLRLALPIRIDADPESGRLSASLEQIPELPLSRLELQFNAGPQAPFSTPSACGSYAVEYSLQPSSGNLPVSGADPFTTAANCPTPFRPRLFAGTASNAAGSAAPFVFQLESASSEPSPSGVEITLPAGLSAAFASIPTCPEAAAAGAFCPSSSRLGYARIAIGSGPQPLWVPGGNPPGSDVFLAGPYRGAPYSVLIRVPAEAGPFDLGTVVLRGPVRIDPATAQISVQIAGLPLVLGGVPLRYRAIRLVFDRRGFVRNPTSCEPMAIAATVSAANGESAALASRYQAADCAALPFRPRLRLGFAGGLARNGHPQLRASLSTAPGEADLAAARFTLPAGELLDLRHVRALCPRRLAPQRCPAASRVGSASLRSPLLARPLRGPIFLLEPVRRLPDLLADVEGGGIHLTLHGHTSSHRGQLAVGFSNLPDVPFSRAMIVLAGGRRGLLSNSEPLCARARRGAALLSSHSGRRRLLHPRLRLLGRC